MRDDWYAFVDSMNGERPMKTPPGNLKADTISAALSTCWNMNVAGLAYAPVGFGSHHWIAETTDGGKWFITVDDLLSEYRGEGKEKSFEVLGTAFQATAALRDVA